MSHGTRVYESLERLKAIHGEKFDPSDLPAGLLRCALTTDTRVKLNTGEFGRIGITTGWKPALILLHNSRSTGSSRVLTAADYVTHIQGQRGYVAWYTFPNERPAAEG